MPILCFPIESSYHRLRVKLDSSYPDLDFPLVSNLSLRFYLRCITPCLMFFCRCLYPRLFTFLNVYHVYIPNYTLALRVYDFILESSYLLLMFPDVDLLTAPRISLFVVDKHKFRFPVRV